MRVVPSLWSKLPGLGTHWQRKRVLFQRERERESECVCVCWRGTDRVMCEVTLKERRTCILCNNARSPALLSIIEIGWNL